MRCVRHKKHKLKNHHQDYYFFQHIFLTTLSSIILQTTNNFAFANDNDFDASKDLVKIRGYPLVSVKTLQSTKIVFEQLTSGNEQLTINIAPRGKRTLAAAPSYTQLKNYKIKNKKF